MKWNLSFFLVIFLYGCATPFSDTFNYQNYQGREVVIVDIDHTIADVSSAEFLFLNHTQIQPLEGSVEVLSDLSKKHIILYLTARHEIFSEHTLLWLKHHNFPQGDVLFWNLTDFPFTDEEYKKKRISLLKNKKIKVLFGVGDKESDLNAYSAFGIKSFIINKEMKLGLNKNIFIVSSWREIHSELNKAP